MVNTVHSVHVSSPQKYPAGVPSPIKISPTETVTLAPPQKIPISVTQSVTQFTPQAKPLPSHKRKLLLHDQNISPSKEIKMSAALNGAHAHQMALNLDNALLPHGPKTTKHQEQNLHHPQYKTLTDAEAEITNGITEDQIDLDDDTELSLWRCGQCQQSFTQRALLQIHVCPGMPNRPYKCGHCADSFSQSNELRTHVVRHTNEKPFKCGYCSRSFAGATTLNNHIRTHTGEKPFICSKCKKMFSTASQLSRHQRIPAECI
jgi:uncharacterized Zn-finger protein